MTNYRLINNITGWVVFIVAGFTYIMTIEPTASLWDCGEFIASSYKLEIGHPPGNPVFMVIARFFTLFAGSNESNVAAMVNAMSALASAFTVLFLFWTITHLARKILFSSETGITRSRIVAVMGAGVTGALAFTFSDSFWFSAVEGEVYATSSLFTAVVFWAILKWEDVADEEYADRWLIFIAFLMGLSIGVHLLNLLALPAIVLVYYFRKFKFTGKGFVLSLGISFLLLGLLLYGIMPGLVTFSSKLDLFFVNSLGLFPNSGIIFHAVLLTIFFILAIRAVLQSTNKVMITILSAGALFLTGIWIISSSSLLNFFVLAAVTGFVWYISGRSKPALSTILTSVMVILIGYSSIAIIVIRSSVNPPINENNPSNPFSLLYFLNRNNMASGLLVYGAGITLGYRLPRRKAKVCTGGWKYIVTGYDRTCYDERFLTLFPRMWSDQSGHEPVYREWGKIKGVPVTVTDQSGKKRVIPARLCESEIYDLIPYGYMYFGISCGIFWQAE